MNRFRRLSKIGRYRGFGEDRIIAVFQVEKQGLWVASRSVTCIIFMNSGQSLQIQSEKQMIGQIGENG
jgi:hypothetical protein